MTLSLLESPRRSTSTPGFVKIALAVGAAAAVQLAAVNASAQSDDSVFTYAFRGLGTGAPIGLSAGYLLTRDESWGSEDWKDLGLGAAIGSISGAAGGLAIGLVDLKDGRTGMGAIVLRDTWYGTLLGITVGAIVGAVRVMNSGEGEDILVSMAWGAVIGAPVGVGVGFAEAALRDDVASTSAPSYALVSPLRRLTQTANVAPSLHFAVSPVISSGAQNRLAWMPTLSGSF
jgi:hypothetical protein